MQSERYSTLRPRETGPSGCARGRGMHRRCTYSEPRSCGGVPDGSLVRSARSIGAGAPPLAPLPPARRISHAVGVDYGSFLYLSPGLPISAGARRSTIAVDCAPASRFRRARFLHVDRAPAGFAFEGFVGVQLAPILGRWRPLAGIEIGGTSLVSESRRPSRTTARRSTRRACIPWVRSTPASSSRRCALRCGASSFKAAACRSQPTCRSLATRSACSFYSLSWNGASDVESQPNRSRPKPPS